MKPPRFVLPMGVDLTSSVLALETQFNTDSSEEWTQLPFWFLKSSTGKGEWIVTEPAVK